MAAGKEDKAQGPGGDWRQALSARELAADERERRTDERDVLAADREQEADQREHTADEREAVADRREAVADARERRADARERQADERERQADERERDLDARAGRLGAVVESLEQRTLETIERSRLLLEASGQRLDRHEAAVKRSRARRDRAHAGIGRSEAEAERDIAAWLPDPGMPVERSRELRKQALAAIEAFAANQEEIARTYEELAGSRPDRRIEYRQSAAQARADARRAREILGSFPA